MVNLWDMSKKRTMTKKGHRPFEATRVPPAVKILATPVHVSKLNVLRKCDD